MARRLLLCKHERLAASSSKRILFGTVVRYPQPFSLKEACVAVRGTANRQHAAARDATKVCWHHEGPCRSVEDWTTTLGLFAFKANHAALLDHPAQAAAACKPQPCLGTMFVAEKATMTRLVRSNASAITSLAIVSNQDCLGCVFRSLWLDPAVVRAMT